MTPHPARFTGLTPDYQRDWPSYFDSVAGKPPRDTTLRALDLFKLAGPAERIAIDIGCGEGRDTRAILAAGAWQVYATDASHEAIIRSRAKLDPHSANRCTLLELPMESLATDPRLPQLAHLINASFALPFCIPASFPSLWKWISNTLAPDGRFAGQFFGVRDEWQPVRPASHFTRAQLESLLAPFEIERLEEVDKLGDDAMGGTKHHHVFHVVARRRN